VELKDYLRILRERWVLIAVTTVVVVAMAGVYTLLATPQYQSTARVFVTTPATADGSAIAQGAQFSQERVKSYATLITGDEAAKRIIKKLNLSESPGAVSSQLSTSIELDTVVLSISATDPSPARAQELAQTAAEVMVGLVTELETPDGQTLSPVKATVVDPAPKPTSPISPQPTRNIGLGLVLGLMLGAGLAVLREVLDNRVRTAEDIARVFGEEVPIIGNVYFDKTAVDEPIIKGLPSHHPRVEAYRVMRTNMQFVDAGLNNRAYVITSSLPSEGKSSTTTNLAYLLADGGQRVLLIEADLRRGHLTKYLNLDSSVGLTTMLLGRATLDEAVQQVGRNFDVLTGGRVPPNPAELLGSADMQDVINEAKSKYDIVLLDCPPLLPVTDAAILAAESDGAFVVVRHGATTTDQLEGSFERLKAVDARVAGTIVTMTPRNVRGASAYRYGYGDEYGYGYAPER
jgi:capsular exopolysaccharide synthesis family protein